MTSLIQLTGYNCISQGKGCSSKGGLLIYTDKRFDYEIKMKLNMYEQSTRPTRFTTCTSTLIDNFFCNLTRHILQSTAGILINTFSDHQPYFMFVDTTLKEDHPTS